MPTDFDPFLVDRGTIAQFPTIRPPANERRDDTTRKALILGVCAFACGLLVLGVYTFMVMHR